jgi:hypothetical protein
MTNLHTTIPDDPSPPVSRASVTGSHAVPGCCVCYTTDPAYLFPTLVSALQARRYSSAAKADVLIFSFGADHATERSFRTVCDAEGIGFVTVDMDRIDGAPVMLARLFLNDFVPAQYGQFLYIDGDTQIAGSLDPLIDAEVPNGWFMAANDPMTFAVPGHGGLSRDVAAHFGSIGISLDQPDSYFNTGVLRISRAGWDVIGSSAWALFRAQGSASRFPDQDVLNIVGGASRIPMSLAWNFPIFMLNSRVAAQIAPRIYHFMSNPKPWHGVFLPWNRDALAPYVDIVAKYPVLARYRSTMSLGRRVRYHLQQRYKNVLETLAWGLSERRVRIMAYETRVVRTVPRQSVVAAVGDPDRID